MIIFVFSILIDSSGVLQNFSSRLMEFCSCDGEEASRTRSSVKSRRRNCVCTLSSFEPELLSVRYWSKSFMKRLNRRGLKLHPCRIPLLHMTVFDSRAYMFCRMASILELRPTEANFSQSRP